VLVGGRSSRMGRDKALLPFRGAFLAQSVARAVTSAAGGAVLVGDPQRHGNLGYPVIPDRYPEEGPLGGILTALHHTSADWNLIAACDMPGLTADFLSRLLDAAEDAGADALVPTTPAGQLEPLCAVWHGRSRDAMEGAFAGGIRQVSRALEALRWDRYPVQQVAQFQNVNTPEDWAGYAPE